MEPGTEPATNEAARSGENNRLQVRAGAVIAIAVLAGFLVWLLFVRDDSASTPPATDRALATAISLADLKDVGSDRHSIWVGPQDNVTYELTRTPNGQAYVRYLPPGEEAGSNNASLTVGIYALPGAFATTATAAANSGSVRVPIQGGGVAFYNENSPTSVYVAFPGSDYQIEVYDPSPDRASRLVSSGQVVAVGPQAKSSSSEGGAKAVSPAGLVSFAKSLDYPIYWIGRAPDTNYEVTETTAGVYLRYLSGGAAVGSKTPCLTIGSYPLADAYAVTKEKSSAAGAVPVATKDGGIAFYMTSRPTSVYVAFPDVDVQLEAYDPVSAKARNLVKSGRLKPVE